MGNSTSHSPEFEERWGCFSENERCAISSIFSSHEESNKRPHISFEEFSEMMSELKDQTLIRDTFLFFKSGGIATDESSPTLSFDSYTITLSRLIYGSPEDKGEFFIALSNSSGRFSFDKFSHTVLLFFSFCNTLNRCATFRLKSELSHTSQLQNHFISSINPEIPNAPSSYEIGRAVQKDLLYSAMYCELLRYVFIDKPSKTVLLPLKDLVPHVRDSSLLLSREAMMFLNAQVPKDLRTKWRKLFSSKEDGASFNTLLDSIVEQGPCALVVADSDGHVFGAFASEGLKLYSKFYGDSNCFLFSLLPDLQVYHPSGYNENYVYCNRGMETLPNGIGFGGQLEYFGLFLSSEFDSGHSKGHPLSTTFSSPVLSAVSDFRVGCVEVWGLGTPPDAEKGKERSALDKNPEALELLEMAGKKIHSKGYRKPESDAEDEDQL